MWDINEWITEELNWVYSSNVTNTFSTGPKSKFNLKLTFFPTEFCSTAVQRRGSEQRGWVTMDISPNTVPSVSHNYDLWYRDLKRDNNVIYYSLTYPFDVFVSMQEPRCLWHHQCWDSAYLCFGDRVPFRSITIPKVHFHYSEWQCFPMVTLKVRFRG